MTWPNTTVTTTNLDAGSDEPRLARADLLDAVEKLNQIISQGPNQGYAVVKVTGRYTPQDRPQTSVANITIPINSGNICSVSANNSLVISPGVYRWEWPPCAPLGGTTHASTTSFIGNVSGLTTLSSAVSGSTVMPFGTQDAGGSSNIEFRTFTTAEIFEISYAGGTGTWPGFRTLIITKISD